MKTDQDISNECDAIVKERGGDPVLLITLSLALESYMDEHPAMTCRSGWTPLSSAQFPFSCGMMNPGDRHTHQQLTQRAAADPGDDCKENESQRRLARPRGSERAGDCEDGRPCHIEIRKRRRRKFRDHLNIQSFELRERPPRGQPIP
jgi:hypothetical protein